MSDDLATKIVDALESMHDACMESLGVPPKREAVLARVRLTLREHGDVCVWMKDREDGYWETHCGGAFEFNDGGPAENRQHFCGYCGRRIEEITCPEPEGGDDERT